MPTNPSAAIFAATWAVSWPGPAFWTAATLLALGVLVLAVVWISRSRLNQTSRRVGLLGALSLLLCGVWLGVCPPPALIATNPPAEEPAAPDAPLPPRREAAEIPRKVWPRVAGPFTPTRSDIFPAEVAAYPDLARADLILNRQPFQPFLELENVAWADGGRTLITADRAGANVWDVISGELRQRITLDGVNSNRVAMSPDGTRLIVMGRRTRVLVWPSLDELLTLAESHGTPSAAVVSPDSRYLALSLGSGKEGYVRVYDLTTGKTQFARRGPGMAAVAWTPDSRYLAVGESRGIVVFLSVSGELIRPGIRLAPTEPVVSVAFSPGGDRLAVCTTESIGVYRPYRREKLWYHTPSNLEPGNPPIRFNRLCFNSDGTELLVRRYQRHDRSSLLAYSVETGDVLREREVTSSFSSVMDLAPDGRLIAYEDRNESISLCDAATFDPVVRGTPAWNRDSFSGDRNFPVGLRPSPGGSQLVTFCTQSVTLWDFSTGAERWSIRRPDWVRDVCWDPSGASIVINRDGNADRSLKGAAVEILDAADGSVVREFLLDDPRGGPILVLSDGRITACGNHHAYQLDPEGNRLWRASLCDGHAELSDIAASHDESLIAVVHKLDGGNQMPHSSFSQGSVFLLDGATGATHHELLTPTTPERVAFSQDGRRVLASTNNHPRRMGHFQPLVEAWSVDTGERENFSKLPDEGDKNLQQVMGLALWQHGDAFEWPLLATQRVIVEGSMGVSTDRRILAVGKPIERNEAGAFPNWSGRLMLWDVEWEQSLGTLVLPSGFWDVAFLPDGRVATLNENGTVFVLRGPG
jgi:WD40 repeat protein